jgi:hypothetical protein
MQKYLNPRRIFKNKEQRCEYYAHAELMQKHFGMLRHNEILILVCRYYFKIPIRKLLKQLNISRYYHDAVICEFKSSNNAVIPINIEQNL